MCLRRLKESDSFSLSRRVKKQEAGNNISSGSQENLGLTASSLQKRERGKKSTPRSFCTESRQEKRGTTFAAG